MAVSEQSAVRRSEEEDKRISNRGEQNNGARRPRIVSFAGGTGAPRAIVIEVIVMVSKKKQKKQRKQGS